MRIRSRLPAVAERLRQRDAFEFAVPSLAKQNPSFSICRFRRGLVNVDLRANGAHLDDGVNANSKPASTKKVRQRLDSRWERQDAYAAHWIRTGHRIRACRRRERNSPTEAPSTTPCKGNEDAPGPPANLLSLPKAIAREARFEFERCTSAPAALDVSVDEVLSGPDCIAAAPYSRAIQPKSSTQPDRHRGGAVARTLQGASPRVFSRSKVTIS